MYTGPKPDGSEYTADELAKGHHWVTTDITCPHCKKEQPVAITGYLGGPCCRCGKRTIGEEPTE